MLLRNSQTTLEYPSPKFPETQNQTSTTHTETKLTKHLQLTLVWCGHWGQKKTEMFILQRMASSHSLFAATAFVAVPLLTKSSLHSNLSRLAWPPAKFELRTLALYKTRNGFSTSSAVATDSSSETLVSDQNEALEQKTPQDKVIVLPTNESSEKLLRIRHTVWKWENFSSF